MRVAVDAPARVRDADEAEHLDRAVERLRLADVAVRAHRLDQLGADLVEGMQRGQRVLEDHRDVVAAQRAHLVVVGLQEVAALEQDLAADRRRCCARVRPITVSDETDLPEPDSPTMPSALPCSTLYETPSTALTMPSSVSKWTVRS